MKPKNRSCKSKNCNNEDLSNHKGTQSSIMVLLDSEIEGHGRFLICVQTYLNSCSLFSKVWDL